MRLTHTHTIYQLLATLGEFNNIVENGSLPMVGSSTFHSWKFGLSMHTCQQTVSPPFSVFNTTKCTSRPWWIISFSYYFILSVGTYYSFSSSYCFHYKMQNLQNAKLIRWKSQETTWKMQLQILILNRTDCEIFDEHLKWKQWFHSEHVLLATKQHANNQFKNVIYAVCWLWYSTYILW